MAGADYNVSTPSFVQTEKRSKKIRRAIRRLAITNIAIIGFLFWLLTDYLPPDVFNARLSAKPAPPPPFIEETQLKAPPAHRYKDQKTLVKRQNLASLLIAQGVDGGEAHLAIEAMSEHYDPRRLRPGQPIGIIWEETNRDKKTFAGFEIIPTPTQYISVRRSQSRQYHAVLRERTLQDRYFLAETIISNSLFEAARNVGLSPQMVLALIKIFSYSVDFQRDIREGDQLQVFYTRRYDDANNLAADGEIIYAALTNRGEKKALWSLPQDDGELGYYNQQGESIRRLLMQTPIDGARLSSGFGWRRHPIKGYTSLHKGLDFAAPTGTPIYAAGDGIITKIDYNRLNGNYIRIKHKNSYETVYLHMHKFRKGLKKGSRVKQGQRIGYVGSTGQSTGPHLHYEVIANGKHVNPRRLNFPPVKKLTADGKQKLRARQDEINNRLTQFIAQRTERSQIQ